MLPPVETTRPATIGLPVRPRSSTTPVCGRPAEKRDRHAPPRPSLLPGNAAMKYHYKLFIQRAQEPVGKHLVSSYFSFLITLVLPLAVQFFFFPMLQVTSSKGFNTIQISEAP
jgi:hypothetical protein